MLSVKDDLKTLPNRHLTSTVFYTFLIWIVVDDRNMRSSIVRVDVREMSHIWIWQISLWTPCFRSRTGDIWFPLLNMTDCLIKIWPYITRFMHWLIHPHYNAIINSVWIRVSNSLAALCSRYHIGHLHYPQIWELIQSQTVFIGKRKTKRVHLSQAEFHRCSSSDQKLVPTLPMQWCSRIYEPRGILFFNGVGEDTWEEGIHLNIDTDSWFLGFH